MARVYQLQVTNPSLRRSAGICSNLQRYKSSLTRRDNLRFTTACIIILISSTCVAALLRDALLELLHLVLLRDDYNAQSFKTR